MLGAGSQPGQTTVKQRQVGLVREVRKDGAVVKTCGAKVKKRGKIKQTREDCEALVWIPGWWNRSSYTSRGICLNGLNYCDIVCYDVSQEVKEGFTAVATNVTVRNDHYENSDCSCGSSEEEDPDCMSDGKSDGIQEDVKTIIDEEDRSFHIKMLRFMQNKLSIVRESKSLKKTPSIILQHWRNLTYPTMKFQF